MISVDWAKYIDEDEENEEGDKGLTPDWDPNNMRDFPEEEDSDDDDGVNDKLADLDQEKDLPTEGKTEEKA